MKVALLTSSFPRFQGDYAGCFILDLARALAGRGIKTTVIAPSAEQARKQELPEGIKIIRFTYFFKAVFQKLSYGQGMSYNLKKSFLAWIQLPLFLIGFACGSYQSIRESDLIWSHWILPAGLLGAVFSKAMKKRHILTVHSLGMPLFRKRLFRVTVLNLIFKYTERIITVNSYIKDELLNWFPALAQKIEVIPMGVERSFYLDKADKQLLRVCYGIKTGKVILFIGRLVEIKGLEYLLCAVKDLTDYTLIIAGDGQLKKPLAELAEKMKINVLWPGVISAKEKKEYLCLSDVVVVPSIEPLPGECEGLPLVVLEALSAGRPVLGSRTGGIPEAVRDGENGFLVEPGDTDGLSARLKEMLSDSGSLEEMGQNAFLSSARFDLAEVSRRYEQVLRNGYDV